MENLFNEIEGFRNTLGNVLAYVFLVILLIIFIILILSGIVNLIFYLAMNEKK